MSTEQLLDQPGTRVIELDIDGMTCASCVSRVERKLGKLDGVRPPSTCPWSRPRSQSPRHHRQPDHRHSRGSRLQGHSPPPGTQARSEPVAERAASPVRVTAASPPGACGSMRLSEARASTAEHVGPVARRRARWPPASAAAAKLRPRLIVAAILTVPVFLISMFPAFQFPNWGWAAGLLALPVVTWAAWPFHRAAAINARHFASTMDTLVSIGVTAAYVFSAWQLFADPRMTDHPPGWRLEGMGSGGLYFEVAAVVTTFLLLGRYLEANAKQKAGDALKALLNLGAKDATVLRDGREQQMPADRLAVGDIIVVRPGEKIATDGVVVEGVLRRRRLAGHRRIRAGGSRPGQPGHGRHHQHFRPPAGPGHARRR